ncbi:MAG: hypothetical protein GXO26_05170, partial [Crenarchaeota archaeon]|nr:hypothetical protein [Thermoproteota archaeon]
MGWRIPLTLVLALILGLLVGVSVYAIQITKLPTTIEIPKAYGPCKKCRDLILLGRLLYECWHSPYWSTKTFVPKAYEYKVCIGGKCIGPRDYDIFSFSIETCEKKVGIVPSLSYTVNVTIPDVAGSNVLVFEKYYEEEPPPGENSFSFIKIGESGWKGYSAVAG